MEKQAVTIFKIIFNNNLLQIAQVTVKFNINLYPLHAYI